MKLKNHFFSVVLFLLFINVFGNANNDKLPNKTLIITKANVFGIKADLEYLDIVLGANNILTKVTGSFVLGDVGKFIAIKKGHHNSVDNLIGSVIPFTQSGRLVTATAYIVNVINGAAIVEVVSDGNLTNTGILLNQVNSDTKRAYMYTNNFDAIHTAMETCYSTGSEVLDFNLDGIVGVNPFF